MARRDEHCRRRLPAENRVACNLTHKLCRGNISVHCSAFLVSSPLSPCRTVLPIRLGSYASSPASSCSLRWIVARHGNLGRRRAASRQTSGALCAFVGIGPQWIERAHSWREPGTRAQGRFRPPIAEPAGRQASNSHRWPSVADFCVQRPAAPRRLRGDARPPLGDRVAREAPKDEAVEPHLAARCVDRQTFRRIALSLSAILSSTVGCRSAI